MKVKLSGVYDTDDAIENIASVLLLLKRQYDIGNLQDLNLQLTLMNKEGQEVELIDAESGETFDWLEVKQGDKEEGTKDTLEGFPSSDDKTVH